MPWMVARVGPRSARPLEGADGMAGTEAEGQIDVGLGGDPGVDRESGFCGDHADDPVRDGRRVCGAALGEVGGHAHAAAVVVAVEPLTALPAQPTVLDESLL